MRGGRGAGGREKKKRGNLSFPPNGAKLHDSTPLGKPVTRGKTMGRYSRPTVADKPAAPARPRRGCGRGGWVVPCCPPPCTPCLPRLASACSSLRQRQRRHLGTLEIRQFPSPGAEAELTYLFHQLALPV